MRKRGIVFAIAMLLALSTVLTLQAQETPTPTVWIKIYRIQAVDLIEGPLEGGADWHYYIWVWSGQKRLEANDTAPSGQDNVVVNVTYAFNVETVSISVYIALFDDDFWSAPDVADISAYPGGGYDNYNGTLPRGAEYGATYDLRTDVLTGDEVIVEGGYFKTSGDYDDSIDVDENDANLWFTIWDNYESPVADAGVDQTVYTGDKVNFDGSGSTASEGSYIAKYEWDFENDGIIDAQGEKTSFTYSEKGQYTVVLRVTDNLKQSDSDTVIVNVLNRAPTASFTYSPTNPTIKDTVNFVDTSEDQDGTIDSWNWDFGDGATSNLQNPTHQYADKGNFTATLTVTDNDGAQHAITQTVTVYNLAPTANFTHSPSEPIEGEDTQFTDESTDPEGKLASWLWDFGDGYTSTLRNPVHKYEALGTYTVTLTVTDDEGVTGQSSKTITIKPVPLYAQPWIPIVAVLVAIAIIGVSVAALALRRKKAASAKK